MKVTKMSIKLLSIILLGFTLVYGDSSSEENSSENQSDQSWDEKVQGCIEEVQEEVRDVKEQASKPFEVILNELKGENRSATMMNMSRWMQLKNEYMEINWEAKEAFEDVDRALAYYLDSLKIKQAGDPEVLKEEVQDVKEKGIEQAKIAEAKWRFKFNEWAKKVKNAMKFAQAKTHN